MRYFETHHLEPVWPAFLDDFQKHWPTDADNTSVDFIRDGLRGNGEDHILVNDSMASSGKTKISFSAIKAINESWDMPGTINIEHKTSRGTIMQYSLTLLGPDDMIKADGARDLDRLIALLEQQRKKYQ